MQEPKANAHTETLYGASALGACVLTHIQTSRIPGDQRAYLLYQHPTTNKQRSPANNAPKLATHRSIAVHCRNAR